jgi:hypothetical protein
MGKGIGEPEWFRIHPSEKTNLCRQQCVSCCCRTRKCISLAAIRAVVVDHLGRRRVR